MAIFLPPFQLLDFKRLLLVFPLLFPALEQSKSLSVRLLGTNFSRSPSMCMCQSDVSTLLLVAKQDFSL